jgi:hypothetical protein
MITPLLVIAQRLFQSQVFGSRMSPSRLLSPPVWETTSCAVIATLALSTVSVHGSAKSIFAVVPQLLVYVAFLPQTDLGARWLPLVSDLGNVASRLCWRVVAVLVVALGAQTVIFGFANCQMAHSVPLGVTKAMSWFFLVRMVRVLI